MGKKKTKTVCNHPNMPKEKDGHTVTYDKSRIIWNEIVGGHFWKKKKKKKKRSGKQFYKCGCCGMGISVKRVRFFAAEFGGFYSIIREINNSA